MKTAAIAITVMGLIVLYSFRPSEKQNNREEGIQFFTGTWQQALDKAKKENKLIFLDAYASWCGPCKMMKHKTFTDKSVGEFYNKHFINVAFDMEQGEGTTLSEKYLVTSYPTLIYANSEGKTIGKVMGFHNPSDFLEIGEKAVKMK